MTTDGFTVQPLEFPGGNIGSLAVHGTVNDLAVSGALPRFMTLNVFLEEGLEIALLRRVIDALADAARNCGVSVVAGDTKVVGRGDCDGIYLAATGVGFRPRGAHLSLDQVRAGDRILVSGPIGEHGAAVMLARQEFGLRGDLESDAASVLPQAQALMRVAGLRFMRDPTRGGLATVAHEIARADGAHRPSGRGANSGQRLGSIRVRTARLRSAVSRLRGPCRRGGRTSIRRCRVGRAAHGRAVRRAIGEMQRWCAAGRAGYRFRRPARAR